MLKVAVAKPAAKPNLTLTNHSIPPFWFILLINQNSSQEHGIGNLVMAKLPEIKILTTPMLLPVNTL